MKTLTTNLLEVIFEIALHIIASVYRFIRRSYRRFCIKVLWMHFGIETPAYHQWHDKRAKKLQALLDNEHSMYPTF